MTRVGNEWALIEAVRSKFGVSDRMKGGVTGSSPDGAPSARRHGVRLRDHVTDTEPITLEEYRRRLELDA